MRPLRFYILLTALLTVTALVSSGWIFPLNFFFNKPKKPDYHFYRPKTTVESLEKRYGVPVFHRHHDPPMSETSLKSVKISFDEEIAFENGRYLIIYYFSKGKFLGSVIKNENAIAEVSESEESLEGEAPTKSLEPSLPDSEEIESEPSIDTQEQEPPY